MQALGRLGNTSNYLRGGAIGYVAPEKKKGNFLVRNLDTAGGIGGGLAGAATGAAIGSAVPGIGTAIGGVAGGLIGAFGGGATGKAASQSLQGQAINGREVLKAGATNAAGELLGAGIGTVAAKVLPKLVSKGSAPIADALTHKATHNITREVASNLPVGSLKTGRDVGALYEKAGLANNIGLYSGKARDKAAKLVTGENGIVNTLKQGILTKAGHVPIMEGLDDAVKRAVSENGVAGMAEKKAIRDAVRAQVDKAVGTEGAIGNMTVPADRAFKAQQSLEKLAAGARSANKPEMAKAYQQVAKTIGGQIDSHAEANAAVAGFKLSDPQKEVITALASKQLGKAKGSRLSEYLIDSIDHAKTIPELRKIEANFIPGAQAAQSSAVKGLRTQPGQAIENAAGAAASPFGKLQLAHLVGQKVAGATTPLMGEAARAAAKVEPALPGVLQRMAGQEGAGGLLGTAPALAEGAAPNTQGMPIDVSIGPSGGFDEPAQPEAPSSPYGKENLMADISRDPKNASTYMQLYKLFEANQQGAGLNNATANTITDATSAVTALKGLSQSLGSNSGDVGPFAGLKTLNPYDTGARTLQSQIDTTRQIVGKFLEGGVLRKEDEAKYKKILPTARDTQEVAQQKIAQVMQLVQSRSSQYQRLVGSGNSGNQYDSDMALLQTLGNN